MDRFLKLTNQTRIVLIEVLNNYNRSNFYVIINIEPRLQKN